MNIQFAAIVACLVGVFYFGILVGGWHNRKQLQPDIDEMYRWRTAVSAARQWLGGTHPILRLTLNHLDACGNGRPMNAGTPCGDEVCTIQGTRTQIERELAGGYTKMTVDKTGRVIEKPIPPQLRICRRLY